MREATIPLGAFLISALIVAVFALVPTPKTYAAVCYFATSTRDGSTGQDMNQGQNFSAGVWALNFKPTIDCSITGAIFRVKSAAGSPTDGLTSVIYNDSAGSPGTQLETGSTFATATGGIASTTSTYAGTTVLTAGTQYWISVVRTCCNASFDNSNFNNLSGDTAHGGNKSRTANGDGLSWNAGNQSLFVEIDGTAAATAYVPTTQICVNNICFYQ